MSVQSSPWLVLLGLWFAAGTSVHAQSDHKAVLIQADGDQSVSVRSVELSTLRDELRQPGLLIWSDSGRDRWMWLPGEAAFTESPSVEFVTLTRHGSRGNSNAVPPGALPETTQLAQLEGLVVLRGSGFVTPPEKSLLLDGRITIRRRPSNESPAFPSDELQILQGNRTVLRLGLDEGEEILKWADISGLSPQLSAGLPPGQYEIRLKKAGSSTTFEIAPAEQRQMILAHVDELRRLLGQSSHPLHLQVAVETLLSYRDESGHLRPLLADALDLLDRAADEASLTSYMMQMKKDVEAQLLGESMKSSSTKTSTNIPFIDNARREIADGQWSMAWESLSQADLSNEPRAEALATLYRAVILAESGQTTNDSASELFLRAIDMLEGEQPADQLRAFNNYATFLMKRTQDRVYNHAFQMSSGVADPLLLSLMDWQQANHFLDKAFGSGETVGPEEVTAVQINRARLYVTLADLLRVLAPDQGTELSTQLITIAETTARTSAEQARHSSSHADAMTLAASNEILAHLAFRHGDLKECRELAGHALSEYLQVGSLAGCESVYRTLGLAGLSDRKEPAENALRELQISHVLTEILRDRVPQDRIGLTSVGFFARRAYVNEKIVELLIQFGRDREALQFAELTKARSLQDMLAAGQVEAASNPGNFSQNFLADWPTGVAAMEYFLGSDMAWVFVISPEAEVTAHVIKDETGVPVPSRELIARINRFIISLDQMGPIEGRRIARAAASGDQATFEQSWQHELHWFYNRLVPKECRNSLHTARTLVVAPHHILHYFPFAAMVTDVDAAATEPTKMPLPRFFLEEPFSLVVEPSLSTWRLLRRKANRPLDDVNVLGIADFGGRASNLAGVNTEIRNLRTIFGDKIGQLVQDKEATETNARTLLRKPGILSMSTHGQKIPDRPLDAFLLCLPDLEQDGYLRAGEIYSLNIEADIVLLNACYGGFADRSPLQGDDLFGIQRALLQGGARTVVSGLWDIYDGTSPDIMADFWTKISEGTAAPRALAEAQKAYLKTWRKFPQEPLRFLTHPYYWAVFTVSGDDRTGTRD